jgi:hypothetical protein
MHRHEREHENKKKHRISLYRIKNKCYVQVASPEMQIARVDIIDRHLENCMPLPIVYSAGEELKRKE